MTDKYKSAAGRYKNQRDELAEYAQGLHRQYLYNRETLKELAKDFLEERKKAGKGIIADGRWARLQDWLDKSDEYYPTLHKLACYKSKH
jgi:hypothetical protein